jgi:hypothetical protein
LVVGGSGFAASATGSTGFVSGAGANCCDSPHPTSTTAAIVVSRRCLILLRILSRIDIFVLLVNFIQNHHQSL